ncbi:hypothetical protein LRS13_20415 [Svornostia abyssi]|uniref:Uncharacterized protein n=1 Tax=Svornostia abyssi TaxID=2898438 RepID=A0ABY5PEA8_9ACTN|nr:hypothetical protein LRS13_20415 [Parviterribacteraceae bacterium J379]
MVDRWNIVGAPEQVLPLGAHDRYEISLEKDGAVRELFVQISYTAAACDPRTLPSPIGDLVRTRGGAFLDDRQLSRVEPPLLLVVSTLGYDVIPRQGSYLSGDRVEVREGDEWVAGVFDRTGEPTVRVMIPAAAATAGARVADVGVVRFDDGSVVHAPYGDIRPAGARAGADG